jgi:hypothetical protein
VRLDILFGIFSGGGSNAETKECSKEEQEMWEASVHRFLFEDGFKLGVSNFKSRMR